MMSGYYGWLGGGLFNRGTYGHFWSSMPVNYTNSRYLYFYSTFVGPKNNTYKSYGFPLRCVARFPCTFSFQSSPQPSSFGYDVGCSLLGQWYSRQ
ncbi:hypothetical protein IKF63_02800 [Candidatus Saccharibacteria bacterium]|nr:hypothetical protein [Candidatus Saccharibacteria bacterium]